MKKLIPASTVALALALATGCGSDSSDPASGPASVVPADMPLYLEATIRPEGEQAEKLEAFLGSLGDFPVIGSVSNPGELIVAQLEAQAEQAGVEFSYAEDVEPWLGEKAGMGITEETDGETQFVLAVETTDEDGARDSIKDLLSGDSVPYEEGEYEGVTYLSAPGDSYRLAVFAGHVVLAPPSDFEAAVEASEGESLGESEGFSENLDRFSDDRLGSLYFDLAGYENLVTDPEDAEDLETAQAIFPEIFEGSFALAVGLSADDQVYLDYSAPTFEGQPKSGESALLDSAAGDALGAIALSDIGAFGQPIVDLFEKANDAGADLEDFPAEGIEAAFEDETGIAFDDAAGAIGDASLWVRGELPDGVEVGGEIEVSDADVAAELLEAIEREVENEGSAKLGPPVGGSDVGFSALEESGAVADVSDFEECSSVGDAAECLPTGAVKADLPFVNVELEGETISYGFFADEEAAADSDPESAGEFAGSEAFSRGEEALGEGFEYLGALDLAPIVAEFVPSESADPSLGLTPEALLGPVLAENLGVIAAGIRYEEGAWVQRYALKLAE